ncbi:MAG: 50S ribosomal protein L18 [Hadesarchaea archaeon]|nr:MAG: 50S ribosomal protein L18 [Hadesarchaea archaeon]HDI12553.1 50S ribosomal protein L18 [Hadesarchaea archaeon]
MTKVGPRYKVEFRRKREGRTDYRRRLNLLRSGKPRLVVRISLKHVAAQVVRATPSGDIVLASAHSKQLGKFGWKAHTSNVPASYLVGLLCGYRALKAGVKESVLDMGMHDVVPQSKVFAVLKGALDAGLSVPHGEGILPQEERIIGGHISQYAERLKKENPDKYRSRFSRYLEGGVPPERIPEHFNEVKQAIITQFGG